MTDSPYQHLLGADGQPIRQDGAEVDDFNLDSIRNLKSGLGTADDRHRHTQPDAREVLDCDELDKWYEVGRFVPAIVDRPARDAVRPGFQFVVDPEDVPEGVETTELDEDEDTEGVAVLGERVRELGLHTDLFDAVRFARAFGGSGLVLITDDANPLDQEIKHFKRIRATHVFDRFELSQYQWVSELEDERYSEPEAYIFHPDARGGPATRNGDPVGQIIHHSRMIPFYGRRLREGRNDQYDGWGQPIPDLLQDAIYDLEAAISGGASAAHEFKVDILKIRGLVKKLTSKEGRDQLKKRMDLMELTKSILNAVAVDADGEDIEQQQVDFGSLVTFIGALKEDLSLGSRIPLSKLFGQMPAGLSSNDDTGSENYDDFIRSEIQGDKLTPPLRRIGRMLFREPGSGFDGVPDFRVVWGALDDESERDRAETEQTREKTRKLEADRHQKDVQLQVISPEESRQLRYGDDLDDPEPTETYTEMEQRREALRQDGQEVYEDAEQTASSPVRASDDQPEKQRQRDVGYTNSSPGSETCAGCDFYDPPEDGDGAGRCAMVRGKIYPTGWCRLWGTATFAAGLQADSYRTDPYSGPSDEKLPGHVEKLPKGDREKWVAVWNDVYERTGDEGKAFRMANEAIS